MKKDKLAAYLQNKLNAHTEEFESVSNNHQFRSIAFGSAGNLSKASKNRLYAYRRRLGAVIDNMKLTKIALKIVNNETFNYLEICEIYKSFLLQIAPEFEQYFITDCFPICKVGEMIRLIFDTHNFPYRKTLFQYTLYYINNSGVIIDISLK